MWRYLYRQRRRIIFCALTFTAMVLVLVAQDGGLLLSGLPMMVKALTWIATGLVLALGSALVMAVMLLLFPRIRIAWEQGLLAGFATVLIMQLVPSVLNWPVIGPIVPFVVMFFFINLIWGAMVDRFRLWVDHAETARFTSTKAPEELWAQLLPTSGAYWDPLLYDVRADPDDASSFEVQYRMGLSTYEHQTVTLLEQQHPTRFKYHFQGEIDPSNRALAEGTYEVTITPRIDAAEGSEVTIHQRREQMLLRFGLLQWFDDALRSSVDHMQARERGVFDWSTTGLMRRQILALS